jgi:hypothetical protein
MKLQRTITCCLVALLACLLIGSVAAHSSLEWTANITYTSGTLIQNLTFGTNEAETDGYNAGLDNPAPLEEVNFLKGSYIAVNRQQFEKIVFQSSALSD